MNEFTSKMMIAANTAEARLVASALFDFSVMQKAAEKELGGPVELITIEADPTGKSHVVEVRWQPYKGGKMPILSGV